MTDPYIANETPAPNATGTPMTVVSCDVIGPSGPLLLDRTVVSVNGRTAWDGSAFLAPFAGPASSVSPASVDGHDGYHMDIHPTDDMCGQVVVQVSTEDAYGNPGGGAWSFRSDGRLTAVYYAAEDGVYRIQATDSEGRIQSDPLRIAGDGMIPAIPAGSITSLFGCETGSDAFTLVSMDGYPDAYGVLIVKNDVNDPRYYLEGYDAYDAQMTPDGTLYVLNRTMNQVEVYYGADFRPGDRPPDFVYDGYSVPPLMGGTLLDMCVAPGASVLGAGRTRFYVGSTLGLARVDASDDAEPDGYSAGQDGFGESATYGVAGSGTDHEVLGDPDEPATSESVIAVYSSEEHGLMLAVTDNTDGYGGLTQIDVGSHQRILFTSDLAGSLPPYYGRDIYRKNS